MKQLKRIPFLLMLVLSLTTFTACGTDHRTGADHGNGGQKREEDIDLHEGREEDKDLHEDREDDAKDDLERAKENAGEAAEHTKEAIHDTGEAIGDSLRTED